MPLQNIAGLIRVGILALPIGGLLVLVGTLFILGVPSPEDNPTVAAKTVSTTDYFLAQIGRNVLGPTLAIFGLLALFAYLVNTGVRRLATLAMVLSLLGLSMLLSIFGIPTYAVPALAQEYLNGQQNVPELLGTIFGQTTGISWLANLLIFIGYVLVGVAIWRSETLPKKAGVLLPVSALGFGVPANQAILTILIILGSILGSVLLVIAGAWVSISILRQPPPIRWRLRPSHGCDR
jgi:hypothetical protein